MLLALLIAAAFGLIINHVWRHHPAGPARTNWVAGLVLAMILLTIPGPHFMAMWSPNFRGFSQKEERIEVRPLDEDVAFVGVINKGFPLFGWGAQLVCSYRQASDGKFHLNQIFRGQLGGNLRVKEDTPGGQAYILKKVWVYHKVEMPGFWAYVSWQPEWMAGNWPKLTHYEFHAAPGATQFSEAGKPRYNPPD